MIARLGLGSGLSKSSTTWGLLAPRETKCRCCSGIVTIESRQGSDDADPARRFRTAAVEVVFRKVTDQPRAAKHQRQGVDNCALSRAVGAHQYIVLAKTQVGVLDAAESTYLEGEQLQGVHHRLANNRPVDIKR